MPTWIFRMTAAWTVLGLASGLYYRELTKANGFPVGTQLGLAHTHLLALGTTVGLVLLALVAALPGLAQEAKFRSGFWVYQASLGLTAVMLLVKGTLQVTGSEAATSKALAGVSGLGHLGLTVAFLLMFLGLGAAVRELQRRVDAAPSVGAAVDAAK